MKHLSATYKKNTDVWSLGIWLAFIFVFGSSYYQSEMLPENELSVKALRFENGSFHQIVEPTEVVGITADWSAQITHSNGSWVCDGFGRAPYTRNGKEIVLSPDDWAGGDCNLMEGETYEANAVWSWVNENGLKRAVSKTIGFVYLGGGKDG